MPEQLTDLPWFMYDTADELLNQDLGNRPWFMRAEVDQVLQPPLAELLGGRENEIDVFAEHGLQVVTMDRDPKKGPAKKAAVVEDAAPSAKFLQARITALSTTMIKRLENIFAVALGPEGNADPSLPPTLTDTSVQQFQLEVESNAIIHAAEEIMMLTRTMKEIWLFGGLDTLTADHDDNKKDEEEEKRKRLNEDVKAVEAGFKRFLERYESTSQVTNKDGESVPV
ncbi:hypothetical protein LTR84_011417 [Exophiala bonariae]|uniref:Mediator of RNA polymerase II transcription subunit 21 n=1 Tax=Exophiala bonariae TaxID=1690606 RepID=A0AAV9MRP7_9EURO|nr:hypothetical protein LTR84_011417 [Exophiala bonariae]